MTAIKELIEQGEYHSMSEDILRIIEQKTNNKSSSYFRVVIAFYLTQMASSMRTTIQGEALCKNPVPVNCYCCALMPSGAGKGHSQSILEEDLISGFRHAFCYVTLPSALQQNLDTLATTLSVVKGTPKSTILEELSKEAVSYGELPYSFDSGTAPALKQIRAKAQLCNAGALNFICDEIGSNLVNNIELASVGLEMFDLGKVKSKITKNSDSSKRYADRDDPVPMNMLWFGTPSKLLNSGAEENLFYSLLETGYARRMLFGQGVHEITPSVSVKDLRDSLVQLNKTNALSKYKEAFEKLAGLSNLGQVIELHEAEELLLMEYRQYCETRSLEIPDHNNIKKTELQHRYWKALKLAGAYAFVDGSSFITASALIAAIKLVEDSGEALDKILHREKAYVKLAKYIGAIGKPMTQADLQDELPFFNGSAAVRKDMLNLASAWGYNNSIMIKSYKQNDIDFVSGDTLEKTNLDSLVFSVSTELAYNYNNMTTSLAKLRVLGQRCDLHWCNHHCGNDINHPEFGNRRANDFIIPGFNLIVLDLDDGTSLDTIKAVLQEYTYFLYTTKRSTEASPRCRVILPMKYKLYLNEEDYTEFLTNVYDAFPFEVDPATKTRSKKWLSNLGEIFYNEATLFDPRNYIPNTNCNNTRIQEEKATYGKIDSLDKWCLKHLVSGSRNDTLYRYGMFLTDKGMSQDAIEKKMLEINAKSAVPLSKEEISNTVLRSIAKKLI